MHTIRLRKSAKRIRKLTIFWRFGAHGTRLRALAAVLKGFDVVPYRAPDRSRGFAPHAREIG